MRGRPQKYGIPTKDKILNVAIPMFLEKGYNETTTRMIAQETGIGLGSFNNCYRTKEDLLLALVENMTAHQFDSVAALFPNTSPVLFYSLKQALQICLCESDKLTREIYIAAYSSPKVLNFIKQFTYKNSLNLFGDRLKEWSEQDFYEVEIAATGLIFGFLAEECNARFNLNQKIIRYLDNVLKLYQVSLEERQQVIDQVLHYDLVECAKAMKDSMLAKEAERVKSQEKTEEHRIA